MPGSSSRAARLGARAKVTLGAAPHGRRSLLEARGSRLLTVCLTEPRARPYGRGVSAEGPILLFDGVCNFCNGAVNFLIDRDPGGRLRFASLQSEAARELLAEHGLRDLPLSTSVLIDGGRAYLDSDGLLRAIVGLGGAWRLLAPLLLIPRAVRDPIYRAFARNRYRMFGKAEVCRVPTPELRARFLDVEPRAPR